MGIGEAISNRFTERRFLLPLIVIAIGAGFVPFALLTGEAWAALAGTLTSAYLGLAGWSLQYDLARANAAAADAADEIPDSQLQYN